MNLRPLDFERASQIQQCGGTVIAFHVAAMDYPLSYGPQERPIAHYIHMDHVKQFRFFVEVE